MRGDFVKLVENAIVINENLINVIKVANDFLGKINVAWNAQDEVIWYNKEVLRDLPEVEVKLPYGPTGTPDERLNNAYELYRVNFIKPIVDKIEKELESQIPRNSEGEEDWGAIREAYIALIKERVINAIEQKIKVVPYDFKNDTAIELDDSEVKMNDTSKEDVMERMRNLIIFFKVERGSTLFKMYNKKIARDKELLKKLKAEGFTPLSPEKYAKMVQSRSEAFKKAIA
jgi:uncharacterized protein YnzC (UPF0291/DUF896 family)